MKKVLLIVEKAPYGSVFAAEALRAGIAFAGMGLDTTLVFFGEGAFCLVKNQKPKIADMTGLSEGFENADEFGLNLFVHEGSLSEKRLHKDDILDVPEVDDEGLRRFIDEAEAIIKF